MTPSANDLAACNEILHLVRSSIAKEVLWERQRTKEAAHHGSLVVVVVGSWLCSLTTRTLWLCSWTSGMSMGCHMSCWLGTFGVPTVIDPNLETCKPCIWQDNLPAMLEASWLAECCTCLLAMCSLWFRARQSTDTMHFPGFLRTRALMLASNRAGLITNASSMLLMLVAHIAKGLNFGRLMTAERTPVGGLFWSSSPPVVRASRPISCKLAFRLCSSPVPTVISPLDIQTFKCSSLSRTAGFDITMLLTQSWTLSVIVLAEALTISNMPDRPSTDCPSTYKAIAWESRNDHYIFDRQ